MTVYSHQCPEDCPDCHELLHTLSEYVDGTLDESFCREIEKHMADCERCQVVIDTLRKTVELYHQLPPAPPLPDSVRRRLFVRLNLDDYLTQPQPQRTPARHVPES